MEENKCANCGQYVPEDERYETVMEEFCCRDCGQYLDHVYYTGMEMGRKEMKEAIRDAVKTTLNASIIATVEQMNKDTDEISERLFVKYELN